MFVEATKDKLQLLRLDDESVEFRSKRGVRRIDSSGRTCHVIVRVDSHGRMWLCSWRFSETADHVDYSIGGDVVYSDKLCRRLASSTTVRSERVHRLNGPVPCVPGLEVAVSGKRLPTYIVGASDIERMKQRKD